MKKQRDRGFTVLELMATVSIMALLASVAVPTIAKFKVEGYRSEAKLGLGTIGRLQDNYFERNGRYARTIDELGFTMDRGVMENTNSWFGTTYRFSITPLNAEATSYQATATGNVDGDAFMDILAIVR